MPVIFEAPRVQWSQSYVASDLVIKESHKPENNKEVKFQIVIHAKKVIKILE